jgi:hypothetical protein
MTWHCSCLPRTPFKDLKYAQRFLNSRFRSLPPLHSIMSLSAADGPCASAALPTLTLCDQLEVIVLQMVMVADGTSNDGKTAYVREKEVMQASSKFSKGPSPMQLPQHHNVLANAVTAAGGRV